MTFRALDNMSDATQHHGLGWGGVGMMTFRALDNMSMLRNIMGWGGVGMMTFRALDNMSDATQHVGCYATIRLFILS